MPFYRATQDIQLPDRVMAAGTVVEVRDDDPPFPGLNRHLRDGSLEQVRLFDVEGRDTSSLPSDWTDIQALFQDIARVAREQRSATFILADDPGGGRRIPRFGWMAYWTDEAGNEQSRSWTITIPALRDTRNSLTPQQIRWLETANGKWALLADLVQSARAQPLPTPPRVPHLTEADLLVQYGRCDRCCDHGSQCKLHAGHSAEGHWTEHDCIFYDPRPGKTLWERLNEDE